MTPVKILGFVECSEFKFSFCFASYLTYINCWYKSGLWKGRDYELRGFDVLLMSELDGSHIFKFFLPYFGDELILFLEINECFQSSVMLSPVYSGAQLIYVLLGFDSFCFWNGFRHLFNSLKLCTYA